MADFLQSGTPSADWLRSVTDRLNQDAGAAQQGTISPPRPRTTTEVFRDMVMGNVQEGETAIGRALGENYQGHDTRQPAADMPLIRFETLTQKPGAARAVAKMGTAMTTAPALVSLPILNAAFNTAIGKLASAGLGVDLLHRAYQQIPEFKKAVDAGDAGRAKEILTTAGIDAVAGAASVVAPALGARLPSISRFRASEETAGALARAEQRAAAATTPLEREAAGIQIKSLSDKAGQLEAPSSAPAAIAAGLRTAPPPTSDPSWRNLLASEEGTMKIPAPADIRSWWQKNEARWLDEFAPIRDLESLGTVPKTESAYQAARLFAGNFGKVVAKERELRRILRPVAADNLVPELDNFLGLERHKELFARPDLAGMYQAPQGLTAQQVDAGLADMRSRLTPDQMAKVERAAQQTRMWSDNTLREYADAGLISQDAHQAILDANHSYAPMQRMAYLADDLDKLPVGGRTFNVNSQPNVKAIKGSEKDVLPATEGFLRNAYRMTTLAERNKVNSRLAAMSEQPEFSGVIRRLQGKAAPGSGEGIIHTFVDGEKQAYAVPKPVADAVSGMNTRDVDTLTGWVAATNRLLVEGSTRFYPPFILKNVWRDFQTATLRGGELKELTGSGFTPIDWLKGFASAIKRDDYFDAYLRSGASFSGFFERQKNVNASLARITEPEWKRVARRLTPWEMMRVAAETSELAPRLGFFRKATDAGLPLEDAGMLTRDATVDFARMGSSMKKLNMWIPFLNARVQGTLATGSAIKNNPGRAAAVVTATIGIPAVSTYVHNVTNFPQVWADISDRDKDTNFIYINSDRKDKDGNYPDVVKIPKGDIGRYTANPLENFLEWYRGADPKGFGQAVAGLASDVSPVEFARDGKLSWQAAASSVLPPIAKSAIVEPLANENLYTGRKIETEAMQQSWPGERYTLQTPPWVVKTGQALGVSPRMLQNSITTQFGGTGRLAAGDVPRDKSALEERTGLGPAARAFTGAHGGAIEQRQFNRAEPIVRDVATEELVRKRNSERIFLDMLDNPTQRREIMTKNANAFIKDGTIDKAMVEDLKRDVVAGAKGMTDFERYIEAKPVESRARVIVQEMDLLPDNQTRGRFLQRFAQVGIVNDDVATKILEAYQKRGYGPGVSAGRTNGQESDPIAAAMKKAFGAAPPTTQPVAPDQVGEAMKRAFGVKQ